MKLVTFCVLVSLGLASLALGDGPPSVADLQQLISDNKYTAAVAYANRLLGIKGTAAAGIDREQTLKLKGEAQLNLKSYSQAADSFAAAAKETTDVQAIAVDQATEVLIRRSHNGAYMPKQPGPDGKKLPAVDIVTEANRDKPVFAELFADEMAASQSKLAAGKTIHTMPELLTLIDLTSTLRQIELAATGKDDESKVQLAGLADHAHALITASLKAIDRRVSDIRIEANSNTAYYDKVRDPYATNGYRSVRKFKKTGLTDQNVSELKDDIATCQKIGPATDQLAKASDAVTDWETVVADAIRIGGRASDVLNADYGNGN